MPISCNCNPASTAQRPAASSFWMRRQPGDKTGNNHHQHRVEARVVVHLELAVDLEVRAAGGGVGGLLQVGGFYARARVARGQLARARHLAGTGITGGVARALLADPRHQQHRAPRIEQGPRAFLRGDAQWMTERPVTERLRLAARAYLAYRQGPLEDDASLREACARIKRVCAGLR